MLSQPLVNKSNIFIAILLVALGITCFFYYQSSRVETAVNTLHKPATTHIPSSGNTLTNNRQTSDNANPRKKPPIAVTPEEKRIVAENQLLQRTLEAGDTHLQTLNIQEQILHDKDQQAQQAIKTLEEKLQGLSQ